MKRWAFLFLLLSTPVQANVPVEAEGCAYGRGPQSQQQARAAATHALQQQLDVTADAWTPAFSTPTLRGNDTCVQARYTPPTASEPLSLQADVVWDNAMPQHLMVTASGRNAQEALRHAIAQAVSKAQQQAPAATPKQARYRSLLAQHWPEHAVTDTLVLTQQTRADGQHQITAYLTVELERLDGSLQRQRAPSLYLAGTNDLNGRLGQYLAEQGYTIASEPDQADLILQLAHHLEGQGRRQLHLEAQIRNHQGDQFGLWRNEPSLFALPDTPQTAQRLLEVHLEAARQSRALSQALEQARLTQLEQGGAMREIWLTRHALTAAEIEALLSALPGASQVRIEQHQGQWRAQLRHPGSSQTLAELIQASLAEQGQPHTAPSAITVRQIRF
ncbi:hypothetical protein KUV89_05810 [Marinobacter hydrocarbonoclasticus]|nr:hypothetical protein [Marinobacter nauticus]